MSSSNSNRYKMSQERLKKELEYMETVREKEVSEQIKEARSFGDLSENSEYDEAKTEQGKLYSKIAEYKDLIEHAEIVDSAEYNLPKDAVTLGSIVVVKDLENALTFDILVRLVSLLLTLFMYVTVLDASSLSVDTKIPVGVAKTFTKSMPQLLQMRSIVSSTR